MFVLNGITLPLCMHALHLYGVEIVSDNVPLRQAGALSVAVSQCPPVAFSIPADASTIHLRQPDLRTTMIHGRQPELVHADIRHSLLSLDGAAILASSSDELLCLDAASHPGSS